ncbi:uncharacterized protein LOC141908652 [Tubulanus polymorphus]|uniref:uncharacterized protein LOC141908652 n=1 Tax=Tubulanus polymorphus TaxID=672921 RepID=UPI003DA2C20D
MSLPTTVLGTILRKRCPRLLSTGVGGTSHYLRSTDSGQYRRPIRSFSKTSDSKKSSASLSKQVELPKTEIFGDFKGLVTDFPCMLNNPSTGPEPVYDEIVSGYQVYRNSEPFHMHFSNGLLPATKIAYETWGELNAAKDNAVLIFTGLSGSSHARSHEGSPAPGWWEKFIGPGCAVDTNKFFVICANHLGGCYGSSGPSSRNPVTGKPYATSFPVTSVIDMVKFQFQLLDHLGIDKLYAAVGSSLGGMCSLAAGCLYPERVNCIVSISGAARSHPTSIALRYLQRRTIMSDPNWKKGYYYGDKYPRMGMKIAREIATISYRSGPEWNQRFARKKINPDTDPSLCPTFLIESYIDYQGESFCMKYDPNSLLYISKAMDLFDLSDGYSSLAEGMSVIRCPVLVIGVQSDILFPIHQQREIASTLKNAGNKSVTYFELDSIYGHDTFLLDLNGVGAGVKGFLETDLSEVHKPVKPRNQSS